jgi:hypothetical protein
LSIFSTGCGQSTSISNIESETVDLHQAQREEVRNLNRKLVQNCTTSISSPDWTEVDYLRTSICKKPNTYTGTRAKYRVGKSPEGYLVVNTRLAIQPQSSDTSAKRSQEIFKQVQACLPEIELLFRRYEIYLDLDIQLAHSDGATQYDHLISVVDGLGRSNAITWYLHGQIEDEYEDFCLVVLHELGHLLSLPDEYYDRDCPDRTFISTEYAPYSIMSSQYMGWDLIDFYPRHLASILKPACPSIQVEAKGMEKDLIKSRSSAVAR